MKKLVLIATLLLTAASAFADLGDTYATSCRKFGGRGTTYHDVVCWTSHSREGLAVGVGEVFHGNQCVAINYTPSKGHTFAESEVWRELIANSREGTYWSKTYVDSQGNIEYSNQEQTIYAKWFVGQNGALRIAYTSFLRRRGLFIEGQPQPTGPTLPPVEESEDPGI